MNKLIPAVFAAVLAAAFAATPADAASACPLAVGTLEQNMANRVVHTVSAGFENFDYTSADATTVEISLEHVLSPAWTCATWSAELLVQSGELAIVGEARISALARADTAAFDVEILDMDDETALSDPSATHMALYERRAFRAVLVVEVFNGNDAPLTADGADAQGRWHFPVEIFARRGR